MKTIHKKPLFDIFSRKNTIIKEDALKQKIIADYREKNSLVPANLKKLNLEIEFKELKVADFLVGNVAIERKTVNDFISSMINRRLLNQLEELQQYPKKLLIIEGIDEQELYSDENITGMNPNSVRGFLLSILLKHNVPIIFTKNAEDTAKFISVIANKKETSISLNAKKKSMNKKEQAKFILEGFPGIGPKSAKKLLEKFKTLKNIFNASEEDLKKILGIKGQTLKSLVEEHHE